MLFSYLILIQNNPQRAWMLKKNSVYFSRNPKTQIVTFSSGQKGCDDLSLCDYYEWGQ